ncbi:MAG: hypothetical protein ABIP94_25835 [Planctomycetota bacterium]
MAKRRGVFLVVAVVCLLLSIGAVARWPSEMPPRVSPEPAAPGLDAAPTGSRVAVGDDPSEWAVGDRVTVVEVPPVLAVKFRKHAQDGSSPFVGTLAVLADGVREQNFEIVNRDPVAVRMPAGAKTLRFETPGRHAVEWDLTALLADSVVFVPDARVRLVVVGVTQRDVAVQWQVLDGSMQQADWTYARSAVDAPREPLVPSGEALMWRAVLELDGSFAVLSGSEPPLHSGECRTVYLDVRSLGEGHYRVVGVSPALLPRLTLRVRAQALAGHWGMASEVRVESEGRFVMPGSDRVRFEVDVVGGFDVLVEEPAGEEYLLRPRSPLVGFWCSDRSGGFVAFSMSKDRARFPAATATCIFDRRMLGPRLFVQKPGEVATAFRTEDLPADEDLVDVSRLPTQGMAALVVRLVGERAQRAVAGSASLELVRPDGSVASVGPSDAMDPGTYGLRWNIGGEPGAWIVREIVLVAGERKVIEVEWPSFERWTGEVIGHAETPAAHRFQSVRFGDWPSLAGGKHLPLDAAGAFTLQVAEGREPAATVEFRCGLMQVRGEVVAVDPERHHVVVRPPSGLRWVSLRVEGEPGGWKATLHRAGSDMPWTCVWSHEQRPILVPPGTVLGGALFRASAAAGAGAPIAWFDVDGTCDEHVVRAGPTRCLEVQTAKAGRVRGVALVGARGQLAYVYEFPSNGTLRLDVPDGTRGLVVFEGSEEGARGRELPIPLGPVLVID